MPVLEDNHYTRAEAKLPELTKLYKGGASTNALAKQFDIRREAIATVLMVAGIAPSTPGRDRLLEYVREHSGVTVDELAVELDMPKSTVSRYLRGTPEQRLVVIRKTTDYAVYSDRQKIAALKDAWRMLDRKQKAKGLSRKRYDKLVGHATDKPSSVTFIRRWGTWTKACEAAGIRAAETRRVSYAQEFSNDDILDGINQFIDETGTTSFHKYTAWAKGSGAASGPLVVIRHGSWSDARVKAINRKEELASSNGRKK